MQMWKNWFLCLFVCIPQLSTPRVTLEMAAASLDQGGSFISLVWHYYGGPVGMHPSPLELHNCQRVEVCVCDPFLVPRHMGSHTPVFGGGKIGDMNHFSMTDSFSGLQ
jgi:hypothetical protein